MNEHLDVTIVKIIILCLAAGYIVFRLLYPRVLQKKRPGAPVGDRKFNIMTTAFLSLLALAAVFSYTNFGRFHGNNGRQVHYWEMFHYYLNAKYFRELGYLDLYDAAVAADAEMERRIDDHARVMDLNTYQLKLRDQALARAGEIKAGFSPQRWEQFKRDLIHIMYHDSRIHGMITDHGFNATPFWVMTGSLLANIVPIDHLWLLAWLDVLLMAVMFVFVFWAFGRETALLSMVFFFASFFTSFFFIGGSFLRYDWLAAAVIGVCCLKKNKYPAGGALLAVSSLLRIFPVLLSAAVAIKMILEIIRQKRLPTRYLKFFGAFLAVTVALVLLLFTLGNPVTILSTYAGRMMLHNNILLTNNVGLKMFVLSDISNLDWSFFAGVYQPLDPTRDVYVNWSMWKMQEAARLWWVFAFIGLTAAALTALLCRGRDDADTAALGTFLIFALLAPTNYYYAFLVILFMVLVKREPNLKDTIKTGLLLFAVASCHVIHFLVEFYLAKFLIISCVLLACFLAIIGIEMFEIIKKKKPVIPAAPSGDVPEGK